MLFSSSSLLIIHLTLLIIEFVFAHACGFFAIGNYIYKMNMLLLRTEYVQYFLLILLLHLVFFSRYISFISAQQCWVKTQPRSTVQLSLIWLELINVKSNCFVSAGYNCIFPCVCMYMTFLFYSYCHSLLIGQCPPTHPHSPSTDDISGLEFHIHNTIYLLVPLFEVHTSFLKGTLLESVSICCVRQFDFLHLAL